MLDKRAHCTYTQKGSLSSVENYRGIPLLSTMGKLFTHKLNDRLTGWAENYQVEMEAQAGFMANMGTTDNIFTLHGLITYIINRERSGSVEECMTQDRGAAASSLTALWSLSKTHLS